MRTVTFWSSSIRAFISQILIYLQNILLIPIIIALAGVEVFGAFSLVISILGIVFGISAFGVGFKARRSLPSASLEERRDLFFPQVCWQAMSLAVLAIAVTLVLPSLTGLLGSSTVDMQLPCWIVVGYLFSNLLYSQVADYFRYTSRVALFSYSTVLLPYTFLALLFILHAFRVTLEIKSLTLAYTVSALSVGVLFGIGLFREIGFRLQFPSWKALGEDIKLGLPFMLSYLVETVLASSDRFIIASVLSPREVGYYVPAYTLGLFIMIIPKVVSIPLPVFLSKSIDAGDKPKAEQLINTVAKFFIVMAGPFVVGSAVTGKMLLELYTNAQVAENAWFVMPIVALGALFYGLTYIYLNVLNTQLNTRTTFKVIFVASIVNVGLNLLILPNIKYLIVPAITTLVAYIIAWILMLHSVRKTWRVEFAGDYLLRVFAASALMGLLAFGMQILFKASHIPQIVSLLLVCSVSCLVYLLLCILLRIVVVSEVRALMSSLSSK